MRISRRRAITITAAALSAALIAACGTTEDTADAGSPGAAASSGPVDLTDERGPVHLPAPATKVVSLEWGLTENLVALGVKPVGQADVKGYNIWAKPAPIDAACSSPVPTTTAQLAGRPNSEATSGSSVPTTSVDGRTGANIAGSNSAAAHRDSSKSPRLTSYTIVDDAFAASWA